MSLTDEEKRKIEAEEAYRAKVRAETLAEPAKKKGPLRLRNLFFAFFLFFVFVSWLGSNSPETPRARLGQADRPVDFTTTAKDIHDQFVKNEIAAKAKFSGKVVSVNGKVDSIGVGLFNSSYIVVDGLQCMLSEESKNKAAALSKGESVVIRGEVSGMTLLNVMVRDCFILY